MTRQKDFFLTDCISYLQTSDDGRECQGTPFGARLPLCRKILYFVAKLMHSLFFASLVFNFGRKAICLIFRECSMIEKFGFILWGHFVKSEYTYPELAPLNKLPRISSLARASIVNKAPPICLHHRG